MDVKFPYEFGGRSFFGEVYRPVAKVSFQSFKSDTWTSIWMVVDTGADFTVLPRYVAADLGISLNSDCVRDVTTGVGGEQRIYLCKKRIVARLGKSERTIPVAFIGSDNVPPLLGRLGFLETFDTAFLKRRVVVFRA